MIGKSVLESELKREYGVTIMGIKHVSEKMILNPAPSTVLQQQDIMILIGQTDRLGQLSQALGL